MSTITTAITTIASTDTVSASRSTINTNFTLRQSKNIRALVDADSPYTIVAGDDCVIAASTAAIVQIYLPTAASAKHRVYTVVNTLATGGGCELFPNGSETINGSTSGVGLYTLYDSVTVLSTGTGWVIISQMP